MNKLKQITMKSTKRGKKHLRIANWNSRGLSAAIPYLREILANNDIVAISEHWLHRNQLYKLNEVDSDFFCIGKSSRLASEEYFGVRRGSGGVAIYWRKNMSGVSPLLSITHDRVCGIRIQTESNTIINVLSVYMLAVGSCDDHSTAFDELSYILESLEDGAVNLVIGDFNGDIGHMGGPRGSSEPTRAGRVVIDFMDRYDFRAANLLYNASGSVRTFECHNGTPTIDYALIPEAYCSKIVKCHTEANNVLNTSDHFPIQMVISIGDLPGVIAY